MKLAEMKVRLEAVKADLDNACDIERHRPSDQRLAEVIDNLREVVSGIVKRLPTTKEDTK